MRPMLPHLPMERPSWKLKRMRSRVGFETLLYSAASESQNRARSVVMNWSAPSTLVSRLMIL